MNKIFLVDMNEEKIKTYYDKIQKALAFILLVEHINNIDKKEIEITKETILYINEMTKEEEK